MKTKLFMNEVIIVSEFTVDDIKRVKGFNPEALELRDENGDTTFAVTYDDCVGGVSNVCVTLNETTVDGKAAVRVMAFGEDIDAQKRNFAEKYGRVLSKLEAVEAQMTSALANIEEEINAAVNVIETVEI